MVIKIVIEAMNKKVMKINKKVRVVLLKKYIRLNKILIPVSRCTQ